MSEINAIETMVALADTAKAAFAAKQKGVVAAWLDDVLVVVAIDRQLMNVASRIAAYMEREGIAEPEEPTSEQLAKWRAKTKGEAA